MDRLSLQKYRSTKPFLILRLDVSGKKLNWLIPKSSAIKKSVRRLAIEMPGTVVRIQDRDIEGRPLLVEKCGINIKYFSKRKIVFNLIGTKLDSDEFVMLIPSWGLRTEKKIWVLIPV